MTSIRCAIFSALLLLSGCALRHQGSGQMLRGPAQSELPLYRNQRAPDKIYVLAKLPDGKDYVFMVDTGSSLTTISTDVANALELTPVPRSGRLVGLGGSTSWTGATLASLRIGDFTLQDVDVAIGVAGLPTQVGLVPLAGIIGNNIWSQFQVAIDYRANSLVLARGELPVPRSGQPMFFNGQHPVTRATIHVDAEAAPIQQLLLLEIDTGARGLLLMGQPPPHLVALSSIGEEPILGIGSPDDLPASTLLRKTRRIHLSAIRAGGLTVKRPLSVTWIHDAGAAGRHRARFSGLLGHDVLEGHRVFLDYLDNRFAIVASTSEPSSHSIHEWYLRRAKKRTDAKGRLEVVRTLLWLGRVEEARSSLKRMVEGRSPGPAALVLHARLERTDGKVEAAQQILARVGISDLIAHGEFLAWANSLWLGGDLEQAISVTQEATAQAPDNAHVWIARSDALRASGRLSEARAALHRANQIQQNPDGQLLRRAWLALEGGDQHAAITHLRRLLELYPASGIVQLMYAKQALEPRIRELIRQDLLRAQARLHQGDGPLDFMAGAWHQVGDAKLASTFKEAGLRRDCTRARSKQSEDNCRAWYQALVHQDLDDARIRIDRAVKAAPERVEFLDTLAMVLEAQGHRQAARDAAISAARLAPDDVYLLLQAVRLASAANTP